MTKEPEEMKKRTAAPYSYGKDDMPKDSIAKDAGEKEEELKPEENEEEDDSAKRLAYSERRKRREARRKKVEKTHSLFIGGKNYQPTAMQRMGTIVIMCAGIILGLAAIVLTRHDAYYYFSTSAPADLGYAIDWKPGVKNAENSYVSMTGTPSARKTPLLYKGNRRTLFAFAENPSVFVVSEKRYEDEEAVGSVKVFGRLRKMGDYPYYKFLKDLSETKSFERLDENAYIIEENVMPADLKNSLLVDVSLLIMLAYLCFRIYRLLGLKQGAR